MAIPGPVAVAVRHEIGSLSPTARRLAQGAAVVGEPFDPELAARGAALALRPRLVEFTCAPPPTSATPVWTIERLRPGARATAATTN